MLYQLLIMRSLVLVHNAYNYDETQGFSTVPKPDAAAEELAQKIGGQPRVKFNSDPDGREFDAISDEFIAQSKPAINTFNKKFRKQAKATFDAAKETGRKVYFEFDGLPAQEVIDKLNEYSTRYGVPIIIDIK